MAFHIHSQEQWERVKQVVDCELLASLGWTSRQQALDALGGEGIDAKAILAKNPSLLLEIAKPAARFPRPSTSSANGKKKAPHGQRMNEFLAALERRPGATPSEIAAEIGISANQAHTLVRRLRQKGQVRKSGKTGYRVAAKASA